MINASQPTAAGTERAYTRDCTIELYHAELEHDSNSSLRLFDLSPAAYFHQRISKRYPPKPTTDAMRLGTVMHTAILEPHKYDALVAVIPADVLSANGSRAGNAWKAWQAENAPKLPIKQQEADELRWIIDSVWENKAAADLLKACTVFEHSIFWTDDQGNPLKTRPDGLDELGANVPDLKRSCHPGGDFWKSVRDFSYHRANALIQDGCEAHYGVRPRVHFIAVGSEPPYDCYVWTLPEELIERGRTHNRRTLAKLRACKDGRRPWKPEGFGFIQELQVPDFLYEDSI